MKEELNKLSKNTNQSVEGSFMSPARLGLNIMDFIH
jgi:hypothetical protein